MDTIPDIALKMSEMEKVNVTRRRMVVITQGGDPIVVAYGNTPFIKYCTACAEDRSELSEDAIVTEIRCHPTHK